VADWRLASRSEGFLGLLDPRDREDLTGVGRTRRYRRRTPIIIQGDLGDAVFILLAGRVKVTVDTAEGREVVLAVDGPGDAFGYFEAIERDAGSRTAAITALEPVECLMLTGDEFRAFLDTHPGVTAVLLRWVIHRLWAADHRRIEFGSLDVPHRLARFILEIAERHGRRDSGGLNVDIPLTQDELASLISASRDSVVRALTTLRTRGLVTTARRKLAITDVDGLRRYANGQP
jgi:CRP/FNR family transcriptional regulator, cyclic AMP receptor protein